MERFGIVMFRAEKNLDRNMVFPKAAELLSGTVSETLIHAYLPRADCKVARVNMVYINGSFVLLQY